MTPGPNTENPIKKVTATETAIAAVESTQVIDLTTP
jgi:hypothetical protein